MAASALGSAAAIMNLQFCSENASLSQAAFANSRNPADIDRHGSTWDRHPDPHLPPGFSSARALADSECQTS